MRKVDAKKLVFLDESAAHTAMSRTSAWIPKGEVLFEKRPCIHWNQLTMVGAVTTDGWLAFSTSWQTMNKERFETWVKRVLAPRLSKGQIVILDNLRAHHSEKVRKEIEKRGARVKFLPPYSPDQNPIEPCWAILKKDLRRKALRCKDELRVAARNARLKVKPEHVEAFAKHSGYRINRE